jgi:hypothetical protein
MFINDMQAMYDSAVGHNLQKIVNAAEDARKVGENLIKAVDDIIKIRD